MTALDRVGRFKARPLSWRVKTFASSSAVAVAIEFQVVAQLEPDNSWTDWSGYAPVTVWGDVWIVKKDGRPNQAKVETLCQLFGWGGSLREFLQRTPPDVVVQISVEEEIYQGKTSYRASWIDAEDASPTGGGADEGEIAQLDARFGSLLRAAASGSKKAAPPPPKAPRLAPAPVAQPVSADPTVPASAPDFKDVPF